MRWKWSERARSDLIRIYHRIAADNPRAAERWVRNVRERARLAGQSPRLGRKVPERDRDDLREAILGNYRMVYLIGPRAIVIATIFEGHLPLPELE